METIDLIQTLNELITSITYGFYIAIWYVVFFMVSIWYFTIKFWEIVIAFIKSIFKITTEDQSSILMWIWILIFGWVIMLMMVFNSENIIDYLYN